MFCVYEQMCIVYLLYCQILQLIGILIVILNDNCWHWQAFKFYGWNVENYSLIKMNNGIVKT